MAKILYINFLIFLIVLNISGCSAQKPKEKYRLLFIGNSLTYTNDLPKLVKEEATKTGIKVTTEMLAFPNYALEDHLVEDNVPKMVKKGNYDFVIIQQGPSSQLYGLETLIDYGKILKELCVENGANLAFFMVWPSRNNYQTYDKVIYNYTKAAKVNNAILCPVGRVWKNHFKTTHNFDYYGNDGFHPSLKGSRNAAEIIVHHLFPDF